MPPPPALEDALRRIRQLVAEDQLEPAVDQTRTLAPNAPQDLANEAVLLAGRLARLNRQARTGLVDPARNSAERVQIASSALGLLNELARTMTPEAAPVAAPAPSEALVAGREVTYEAILGVNNLRQIAWLEQGVKVSRAVCRILTPHGLGTGFLGWPCRVMTNNHVIDSAATASGTKIEFNYQYQLGTDGKLADAVRFELDPDTFFRTNPALDYTVVAVKADPAKHPLASWGTLQLNPSADPIPTEHVVIVQHPNGGPKQIVLTANTVLQVKPPHLHYSSDTMPGSSGSPVFNDMWQVIAIHHAAGPKVRVAGGHRYSNEGILMSAIQDDMGTSWSS